MSKSGSPTYLGKYVDSLIVESYDIEGGHGLSLYSNALSYQLQHFVKAVKCRSVDNEILKTSFLKYLHKIINNFN